MIDLQLPQGFKIGQRVQYKNWFLSSTRDERDIVKPDELARMGENHIGFIAGFVTIEGIFYYIVLCNSKIELVLPEDIRTL